MRKYYYIIFILTILFGTNSFCQTTQHSFKVEVSGKGNRSIIFIPGFASSGDVWKETRKLFEKDYTCYVLTMPGFAGVAPETDPSMIGWENEIASFIKTKQLKQPIIIGHSLGGVLAMAIASDYPNIVSKIVVVDALPCLPALSNPKFVHKEVNDCSPLVRQFTSIADSQFYKMQKGGMMQMVADTAHREEVIQWSMTSDRKTFAQMYCDFSNTDLREKIASIKCPALVLLEPFFKAISSTITEQYKNLKTAQLTYATKGLHFIMYDDPSWYNEQLKAFFK